jgi:hypothetical protein
MIVEAVPKLQFLEQLLTPGENCTSRKCLPYKELAIFSKSLFQTQPGFPEVPYILSVLVRVVCGKK